MIHIDAKLRMGLIVLNFPWLEAFTLSSYACMVQDKRTYGDRVRTTQYRGFLFPGNLTEKAHEPLNFTLCLSYNEPSFEEDSMGNIVNVEITMYGIAEVISWCHDRNKGRIPGVDTPGLKKMQE